MTQQSDLSRLVRNSMPVAALVTLLIACIFVNTPPDEKHFYQASLHKTQLLRNLPSPRIILVGGSHVALGIAPLNEVKRYIRSGDIIIISLEYYNFTDEMSFYGLPQYLADWVEYLPDRIWDLHDPYRQIPSIYTIMLQRKVNRSINYYLNGFSNAAGRGEFTGDQFNDHGDFVGHLDKESPMGEISKYGGFSVNQVDEAYEFLVTYNQFAQSKGAIVFYEAPSSRQTNCELTGIKYIRKFFNVLKTRTKIPLLNSPDEICYPDEYFYDTPFHLNAAGRQLRTEMLIRNLKAALGK
jgi:hypothetical protein